MATTGSTAKRTPVDSFVWALGTIVVVVYALVPILWLVSLSLKPADKLNDGKFFSGSPTFENYRTIFKDPQFKHALVNSIGIALIATVLAVALAMFAAYAIVRLDFPGKKLVLSGALAIAMFPPVAIIGPLFNMWRALHLFDTWAGLIIPYMTFTLPLAIWTLSAFFREIPWDLDKAARVDGATPFQAFRRVIAPLAAPGVSARRSSCSSSPGTTSCSRRRSPRRTGPARSRPRSRSSRAARSSTSRPAPSPPRRSSSPSRSSSWC